MVGIVNVPMQIARHTSCKAFGDWHARVYRFLKRCASVQNVAQDRHARQKAAQAAKEAQVPDPELTKKAQAQREKNALKEVEALEALTDSRLAAEVSQYFYYAFVWRLGWGKVALGKLLIQ